MNSPSAIDVEPYLARIRAHFPDVRFTQWSLPKQGLDHLAIFLDDRWVFRFPVNPEYTDRFPAELRLLEELRRHIDAVPVPVYTLVPPDYSFGGYALIRGEEFTPEICGGLSSDTRKTVVSQLVGFVSQLHRFPAARAAAEFAVPKPDIFEELATLERDYEEVVKERASEDEREACRRLLADLRSVYARDIPFALTHSDLTGEHILIAPGRGGLAGIIDFGDKAVFDPAVDFAGFWEYGADFVASVYAGYDGRKDEDFLRRSLLLNKRMHLYWLANEIRHAYQGDWRETYEHFARAIRRHMA